MPAGRNTVSTLAYSLTGYNTLNQVAAEGWLHNATKNTNHEQQAHTGARLPVVLDFKLPAARWRPCSAAGQPWCPRHTAVLVRRSRSRLVTAAAGRGRPGAAGRESWRS